MSRTWFSMPSAAREQQPEASIRLPRTFSSKGENS